MFCTKCGANIADGSKFCTRCGAAANAAPPIISAEPAAPAPVPKEKNNRTLMIILIAALAVAVIAGIVLTVVLLSGANSPEQLWQEQYDLGNRYLSDGEYEEAAIAFLAAIDIDPKRPEAYRGAADAYIAMGDYESASEILDRGAEETGEEEMRSESEQILHQMQEPSLPDQKKLTQICRYNSNGALDIEYVFSYDEKDRIVGIRYSYHTGESTDEYVHHLSYDDAGRLLLYSTGDPSDLSSYGFTQYEYNDAGQLTRRVNKEGSSSEELYEYDAQGLLTRSVETNDFYEQTTDYFHNETGQLIYKERYNNLYSDIEAYYYEYDGQGRIAVETYEMAPYESTSTYDYSYKNFVLIRPDDGYDRLVMQDIMGHEIFSLSLQAPQFSADAEGFLTQVTDVDYIGSTVTYQFIYEGGVAQPEQPPVVVDAASLYTEFLLSGGYDEIAGYEGMTSEDLQVRSCLVDFDEDGIEELLLYLSPYANEYYTALLDIQNDTVFIAASAFESGGTMGGSNLSFKYEQKTQSYALVEDNHWRDGVFSAIGGLRIYSKHTYDTQEIFYTYYNLQQDSYGNIYVEMAADVRRETSYYTQDGNDFYFYTINDAYVSEESYYAATYGYTNAEDPAYQLRDASYYAPIAN